MSKALKLLSEEVYAAERAYGAAVEARFRPGDRVHVSWGDNLSPAVVLWARGTRVGVKSRHGKEYSVYAYRLNEHRFR